MAHQHLKTRFFAYELLDILEQYSSKNNPLTYKTLKEKWIKRLTDDHPPVPSQRTIKRHLEALDQADKICINRSNDGRIQSFYRNDFLGFTQEEKQYIVYHILYDPNISFEKTKELIRKLKNATAGTSEPSLRKLFYDDDYLRCLKRKEEDDFTKIFKTLSSAIEKHLMVQVRSSLINTEKKKVPKYATPRREAPLRIIMMDGNFYVMMASKDFFPRYRKLMRIFDVSLIPHSEKEYEKIERQYKSKKDSYFDQYKQNLYAINDRTISVNMKIAAYDLFYFQEFYGDHYEIKENENGILTLDFKINETTMEKWAKQYSELVEIIQPEELRERIKRNLEMSLKKYQSH